MSKYNPAAERFLQKFDELHYVSEEILGLKDRGLNLFRDSLADAYAEGIASVNYMLGIDKSIDYARLDEALDIFYGEESIFDKMDTYIAEENEESARRLLESEWHRMYAQGQSDACDGEDAVEKVWHTMLDDKVRDNHFFLEGVSAPSYGKFYTPDGDSTEMPGGFTLAENNANCRCWLEYRYIG